MLNSKFYTVMIVLTLLATAAAVLCFLRQMKKQ